MTRRRGFTLAEVVVALVIAGIVGIAMTRVLTSQNRFFDQQTNQRAARDLATNAMNVMLNDLRMVQDSGGVDNVASDGKTIRIMVPYRFGMVCGTTGTKTIVSMLPTDSGTTAMAVYGGFAWRSPTTGRYTYVTPSAPTSADAPAASASASTCTSGGGAQLTTVSLNGRTGDILDLNAPAATGATVTAPVFLWQKVTYSFAASSAYPGMIGLWRNISGGANEELMAPFDTSARFRFYTSGSDVSQVTVPADINTIRGLDIVLNARSPRVSSINNTQSVTKLTTAVFFKNVRTF
jgi:prepilin-type N-terminal cleavage/methylation domain-containing protein